VRLGDPRRFADYAFCTLDETLLPGPVVWLEIDYQAFREQGEIAPCMFLDIRGVAETEDPERHWSRIFSALAGKGTSDSLKREFFGMMEKLPSDVPVMYVGSMARPGDADSLRVVLLFHDWEKIPGVMEAIGWPGDAMALANSLATYADMDRMAVHIDLANTGVRKKTGIEIVPRWRHPVLVDRMVSRLEWSGLCLPDKGNALRRWVRIQPDSDPYIQTVISHYKLSYENGVITGAKAYLQQTPYPLHVFYPKDRA
jgi:hypothetical protein